MPLPRSEEGILSLLSHIVTIQFFLRQRQGHLKFKRTITIAFEACTTLYKVGYDLLK
jgi:hypothetical protein